MKKLLYITIFTLTITACSKDESQDIGDAIKIGENTKLQINAKLDNAKNLVGVVSKELLEGDNKFKDDFSTNYNNYKPNKEVTKDLKTALNEVKIVGYLGTWCPDSRREIPKFYKIMESIKFTNFDMIAVNNSKKANGLEKRYNLKYVPTFILIKNNKEIGRFVESINGDNSSTLEKDLLIIAKSENYTPGRQ